MKQQQTGQGPMYMDVVRSNRGSTGRYMNGRRLTIMRPRFTRFNQQEVKTKASIWGTWTLAADGQFIGVVSMEWGNLKALLAQDGQQLYSLLGAFEKIKVVGYKQEVFLRDTDDLVEDNAKAVQIYQAYDPDNSNTKSLAEVRARPDVKVTLLRPYQKKAFYLRPKYALQQTLGNVTDIGSVDNSWVDCNQLINTTAYNNVKSINGIQVVVQGSASRVFVVHTTYYVVFKGLKNTSV